jgi:hypothetical protein
MQAPGWSCSGLQNGPNYIYAGLQVGFSRFLNDFFFFVLFERLTRTSVGFTEWDAFGL